MSLITSSGLIWMSGAAIKSERASPSKYSALISHTASALCGYVTFISFLGITTGSSKFLIFWKIPLSRYSAASIQLSLVRPVYGLSS